LVDRKIENEAEKMREKIAEIMCYLSLIWPFTVLPIAIYLTKGEGFGNYYLDLIVVLGIPAAFLLISMHL